MLSNANLGLLLLFADSKSAMPALANVHVTADTAMATDLYSYLEFTQPPGSAPMLATPAGVPGDWLKDIIRLLGKGARATVPTFEATPGGQVTAHFNGKRLKAHGLPGGEMPKMARAACADAKVQPLNVWDFLPGGTVHAVLPFVSTDETRPHVNSVLLHGEAVATNGHALAYQKMRTGLDGPVLVSLDAMKKLLRVVSVTEPDALSVKVGGNVAEFSGRCSDGSTCVVQTRLIDAQFPPYQHVIAAKDHPVASVSIDVDTLRALLHQFRDPRVAFFRDGGMVAWDNRDLDKGLGLSVESYPDDSPLTILSGHVLDYALKSMPKGHHATLIVTSQWPKPDAVLFGDGMILMPINVCGYDERTEKAKDDSAGLERHVREAMAEAFGLAEHEPHGGVDVEALKKWLDGPFDDSKDAKPEDKRHHVSEALGRLSGRDITTKFLAASTPYLVPSGIDRFAHHVGELFSAGFVHRDAKGGWEVLKEPRPVKHDVPQLPPKAPPVALVKPAKGKARIPKPPESSPEPPPSGVRTIAGPPLDPGLLAMYRMAGLAV
jgi:hypothetical protein